MGRVAAKSEGKARNSVDLGTGKVLKSDILDEKRDLKVKESKSKWDRSKKKMERLGFKNSCVRTFTLKLAMLHSLLGDKQEPGHDANAWE